MTEHLDLWGPGAAEAIDRLDLGPDPLVGLDFDGTLSPIVETPGEAELPPETRDALRLLSAVATVAVVSGRDAVDVRSRMGVAVDAFAGSHGFDITDGSGKSFDGGPADRFESLLPLLDNAEERLRRHFAAADGVIVERKRFGVATHFRRAPDRAREVADVAGGIAAEHPDLRLLEGKAVAEIRPAVDWDKGLAVEWLTEHLGPFSRVLYVGDDTTDEDVFERIADDGVGILVSERTRPTAARFRIDGPDEVRRLVELLAERCDPRRSSPPDQ